MNRIMNNLQIFGMNILVILISFFLLAINASAQETKAADQAPDQAAEYFFYTCAGCHTVGEGKRTGPDLIDAAKWAESDLRSAIKKMEKNTGPLSDERISQLIQFLKDIKVSDRITNQRKKIEAQYRAKLPKPSYELGKKIFHGEKPLVNGGPACISCHRFGNEGGSLGLDLTKIKDKLTGIALQSAIEKASYKVMRPIYEKHVITSEEALHISEFLSHPEKNKEVSGILIEEVVSLSLAGTCGFFILIWIMNQKRKGPTRRQLVENSKKGTLS